MLDPPLVAWMLAPVALAEAAATVVAFRVADDANVNAEGVTTSPGDTALRRTIALERAPRDCVTCREMPVNAAFEGNLGSPRPGVARRCQAGELRLVDSKRIHPEANMPSCNGAEGLTAVATRSRGRPILATQEVEAVLADLMTLRQP